MIARFVTNRFPSRHLRWSDRPTLRCRFFALACSRRADCAVDNTCVSDVIEALARHFVRPEVMNRPRQRGAEIRESITRRQTPPSPAAATVDVDVLRPVLAGLLVQPQLSLAAQVANVVNVSQPTGAPMHTSVLPQVQLWLVTLATLMSERRTRELQTYEMKRRGFQSKQIRYASRRMPPTSRLDVDRPLPPNDNDHGCPIAANDVAAPIGRGNSTCQAPTETHHAWAQTTSLWDFRFRTLKQSEGAKG